MSRRKGAAAGPMAAMEEEAAELRRGPWTLEEDNLLMSYISCHGVGRWNLLARCSGLKRTGKSCRLRWLNYLKPGIKRGNLTAGEQLVILELHAKWGNRWSRIAQHLPGRTDNDIKNYWRTTVQKQARQLKVDANSAVFRDAVRCYWMPQLLDRITTASCAAAAAPPPLMEQHGGMSSSQSPAIGSDQLCCYPAAGFDPSTIASSSGSTAAAALQPVPVPYFSELNGEDQYYYPGVGNLDGGVEALDSAALLGSLGLDGLDLGPAESYYSDSTLQDYLNYSSCTAASAMDMMMSGGSAMVDGDHHGTTTTCQAPRRLAGEWGGLI